MNYYEYYEEDALIIKAALDKIRREMNRLYWNKYKKEMDSPFDNTGNIYSDDTFIVRAYYWEDDDDLARLPNFEYKDLKCYWYKHSNRAFNAVCEHKLTFDDLNTMIQECYKSMEKYFKEK